MLQLYQPFAFWPNTCPHRGQCAGKGPDLGLAPRASVRYGAFLSVNLRLQYGKRGGIAGSIPNMVSLTLDQALEHAIAHHRAGRLAEAERLYRAILQVAPNHPDAHHNLGVLAVGLRQAKAALPHLKAALEANPTVAQYWLSFIHALIEAGEAEAARQVLAQGQARGLQGPQVDALAARLAAMPAPSFAATASVMAAEQSESPVLQSAQTAQMLKVRPGETPDAMAAPHRGSVACRGP